MTAISVPGEGFWNSAKLIPVWNTAQTRSRDGSSQRIVYPGTYWKLQFSMPTMSDDKQREWRAFLMALEGGGNEFLFAPPGYDGPAYSGPNPLVKGSGQTGNSIDCDGASNSVTVLQAGEYFHIVMASGNRHLGIATADADSDGSGNVTIAFEPMLRESPADNATVVIDAPKGRFKISKQDIGWGSGLGPYRTFDTIEADEAIDP